MKSDMFSPQRPLAVTVVTLIALEVVIVVLSWLVPAIYPYSQVRPLLSPEGARFLVGSLVSAMSLPPLLWLVLSAMSWGADLKQTYKEHHVRKSPFQFRLLICWKSYRQRLLWK